MLDFSRSQTYSGKKHGQDRDKCTRLVCKVILADGGDLSEELVKAGLALWVKKYAPNEEILGKYQKEAKDARCGLWPDPKPKPPLAYRR